MKSVREFQARKSAGGKIVMVSAYSAWAARFMAEEPGVDCILVGDSVAMVAYGEPSTLHATIEMLEYHTRAVARSAPGKFLVADMPFLSFRQGVTHAVECAGRLLRAGAHAVKLENVRGHEDVIEHLIGSGIPVMGHLGLTPQSVNQLGGYRVQGREASDAIRLSEDAEALERLGAFGVVLELVPSTLAARLSQKLRIPTIGIGAGPDCDGQVLVFHDFLGLNPGFSAKFVRPFADAGAEVRRGLAEFAKATRDGTFPGPGESFS